MLFDFFPLFFGYSDLDWNYKILGGLWIGIFRTVCWREDYTPFGMRAKIMNITKFNLKKKLVDFLIR